MKDFEEEIVIRQQMALNSRMYKIGKVSKSLHDRARAVLSEKLAKIDS